MDHLASPWCIAKAEVSSVGSHHSSLDRADSWTMACNAWPDRQRSRLSTLLASAIRTEKEDKTGLPVLPIDDLLIRVHQQRPDLTVLSISGMEYRDSAWELLVHSVNPTKRETHSRWLLVDPGTGEIGGMQTSNGHRPPDLGRFWLLAEPPIPQLLCE
jgi:hypothetical protein